MERMLKHKKRLILIAVLLVSIGGIILSLFYHHTHTEKEMKLATAVETKHLPDNNKEDNDNDKKNNEKINNDMGAAAETERTPLPQETSEDSKFVTENKEATEIVKDDVVLTEKPEKNADKKSDEYLLTLKKTKEQKKKKETKYVEKQKEIKIAKQSASPMKGGAVTLSQEERDLLERLVQAEAGGESYEGKLAVATVVVNRVKHTSFPNTIKGVINQPGQFCPVRTGSINKMTASEDTKKAVRQVVDEGYRSFGSKVCYFMNPKTATSDWMKKSKTFVVQIGNHHFYQ